MDYTACQVDKYMYMYLNFSIKIDSKQNSSDIVQLSGRESKKILLVINWHFQENI